MTALGDFTAGDVLQAADLNGLNNVTYLFGANYTLATSTLDIHDYGAGTEIVDVSNWHSETTNPSRITPTVAGFYYVWASAVLESASVSTGTRIFVGIYKNGSGTSNFSLSTYSPNYPGILTGGVIEMNGTTDYLTMGIYQTAGADRTISRPNFGVMLLRSPS